MAKVRMINTKFWDDDYTSNLDPIEKLLFLYLLTNTSTNICGIYEIPLKKIANETGIDKEMVSKILDRFQKDGKIFNQKGWICLKNFVKNQNQSSPKVQIGIEREIMAIPNDIMEIFIGYGYGIDTLSHLTKLNLTKDMISSKKKSTSEENTKNMKTYNENDFSDSEDAVIDSESGEVVKKSSAPKVKTDGKNQIALRIQNKFAEMCKKNIGTTPILNVITYKQALFALNTGGLTENQIYDLFEEWFTLPEKKDEQLINLTQALSTYNLNGYKVRNSIQ